MRVLIDYRPALRDRTGVGEFVHELAAALATPAPESGRPRVDLTVFSASWAHRVPAPSPLPATVRVVDRRIPVHLLNLAWHRAGWPPVEALTRDRYDVVHSPHPLLLPTRAAAQVITIHDLDFLRHAGRTRAEVRRDYPALVRRHAHRADHILVPSRYTAGEVERLLEVPAAAISVCHLGAPAWPPRPAAPHPGHLLFVGTLGPRKNVSGLLDAYARLVRARPDTPDLVLAGARPDDAPWLDRLARPPLAGRVRCTGYVDRGRLQALYADARVLVLPSFDEGFGLPVLEAMTLGVPVVAADRGSLPEVVGEAGLLVDPANPAALAAAIDRVLGDDRFAADCSTRGRLRSRAFTWPATARAACGAYRKAIETRAARRRRPR